jgi:hypothetical protein
MGASGVGCGVDRRHLAGVGIYGAADDVDAFAVWSDSYAVDTGWYGDGGASDAGLNVDRCYREARGVTGAMTAIAIAPSGTWICVPVVRVTVLIGITLPGL